VVLVARPEVLNSEHGERLAGLAKVLQEAGVVAEEVACTP
jgi:hypothetical protein